jgi:hypothetical protein
MLRVESRMGDILSSQRGHEPRENKHNIDWITNQKSFKKKSQSFDSVDTSLGMNNISSNDPWGWFDEIESNVLTANVRPHDNASKSGKFNTHKTLSLPLPASNPPSYVLESRVETQQLWYETAGQRPQQPRHEREYFESLWLRNFENSCVNYNDNEPPEVTEEDENLRVDVDNGQIIGRGRGPFSIAVSKSFQNHSISCVTLQMPSFRVIRADNGSVFAEFLVVVTFSNIQSLSLGIWRRHSHFADLVRQVSLSSFNAVT